MSKNAKSWFETWISFCSFQEIVSRKAKRDLRSIFTNTRLLVLEFHRVQLRTCVLQKFMPSFTAFFLYGIGSFKKVKTLLYLDARIKKVAIKPVYERLMAGPDDLLGEKRELMNALGLVWRRSLSITYSKVSWTCKFAGRRKTTTRSGVSIWKSYEWRPYIGERKIENLWSKWSTMASRRNRSIRVGCCRLEEQNGSR